MGLKLTTDRHPPMTSQTCFLSASVKQLDCRGSMKTFLDVLFCNFQLKSIITKKPCPIIDTSAISKQQDKH